MNKHPMYLYPDITKKYDVLKKIVNYYDITMSSNVFFLKQIPKYKIICYV